MKIPTLFVLISAAGSVMAQGLDADGERFARKLAETYRAPAEGLVMALAHPKSQACLKAEPKYLRYMMRAETAKPIPQEARQTVEVLAPDAKLPYRGFSFPLRPSHVVRMEFEQSSRPGQSVKAIAEKHIVRDEGNWHVVFPCPTPEGIGRLKEMGLLD